MFTSTVPNKVRWLSGFSRFRSARKWMVHNLRWLVFACYVWSWDGYFEKLVMMLIYPPFCRTKLCSYLDWINIQERSVRVQVWVSRVLHGLSGFFLLAIFVSIVVRKSGCFTYSVRSTRFLLKVWYFTEQAHEETALHGVFSERTKREMTIGCFGCVQAVTPYVCCWGNSTLCKKCFHLSNAIEKKKRAAGGNQVFPEERTNTKKERNTKTKNKTKAERCSRRLQNACGQTSTGRATRVHFVPLSGHACLLVLMR